MPDLHRVTTLDLVVEDWRWPFAIEQRAAIDEYFAAQRAANPALFNGQILLAREPRFESETFAARYFATDFASFLAWRDWGFPDDKVFNCFGMGALRGSDGFYVMGEMAAQTSNAGKIYFPAGTPDLNDIRDGRVDIPGSIAHEVAEETGLGAQEYSVGDVWHCVADGPRIALIRMLDMPYLASEIADRIMSNLVAQKSPEFSRVHVVRDIADVTPAMPSFVAAFIADRF